jgi:thioredoxin reductase (NADPH)
VIFLKKADSIIIGGGIAGLQAAIQLGRYNHSVVVIDSGEGRSSITRGYHNLLGWPDGISGPKLRSLGKQHAEKYGVTFVQDKVVSLKKIDGIFSIQSEQNQIYQAKTVFLATGLVDHLPPIHNLLPCLGKSIYVCPDCDGYEVSGKKTVVLGSGNSGAEIALTLTYWTDDIILINTNNIEISDNWKAKLAEQQIKVISEDITEIVFDGAEELAGILLKNGETIEAERGFIGFGGNKLNNELAIQTGMKLNEKNHVIVNPRTKETSVAGIWAGGDLIAHSEQVTISMGDGSQAAIWMHKRLLGKQAPE